MKRLAFAFVLLSTNAFASDGIKYFSGSNGERGIGYNIGGIDYYHSNRGNGMGYTMNGVTYWDGHGPGGSGKKCDTRMEWCD